MVRFSDRDCAMNKNTYCNIEAIVSFQEQSSRGVSSERIIKKNIFHTRDYNFIIEIVNGIYLS